MTTEIKKKFDINKTCNKAIIHKSWEKLLMEMLEVHKDPIFKKYQVFLNIKINHSGAVSVGANESITLAEFSTSAISDTLAPSSAKEMTIPAKKTKMSHLPETEETQKLSTAELQRLVLLEQLKLCQMQQEEIIKRQKQGIYSGFYTVGQEILLLIAQSIVQLSLVLDKKRYYNFAVLGLLDFFRES
ncbi:unnamed protein product [Acanthoscelides obtectus]|uniref:Uncharacterized protein n=1 Tax=Acanthoscelides obtectus TaxID=200917 RepID=A0A9P0JUP4_ACAOB|nr:unnamed protein product [Acanthoscelides obtectus]CAK1621175.1 hypothetical protein AOBTE_LOCUS811 [Acanthoscelides obtectus]